MTDSDPPPLIDKELRDQFIIEIKEDIERLESDLLTMEKNTSNTVSEVINSAFRAIHSIKGGAGFCELNDLGILSHSIENVLMGIRDKKIDLSPDIIDAIFAGLDKIKCLIENIDSKSPVCYVNEKQSLEKIISQNSNAPAGAVACSSGLSDNSDTCPETFHDAINDKSQNAESGIISDKEINESDINEGKAGNQDISDHDVANVFITLNNKEIIIEQTKLRKAFDEGKFVYKVLIYGEQDILVKHKNTSDMIKDIEDSSDILFSDLKPDLNEQDLKGKIFNLVLATILDTGFLSEVLEINSEQIVTLDYAQFVSTPESVQDKTFKINGTENIIDTEHTHEAKTLQREKTPNEKVKIPDMDVIPDGKKISEGDNKTGPSYKIKTDENIRINTRLIAKLMNLAGELVLTKNQLHPILEHYLKEKKSDAIIMQNFDRVTSEIQEYIMRMRMQPVGKLFERFRRIVRDTAKKLSKKVNYTMEGGEVELDRTILEGLANPLIHLLRNSLDHGIELPDERLKAKKPETGMIQIKAVHHGGHVYINLQDDGKGMDPEKIALSAVEKGIITEQELNFMTEIEKINIIFKPGFSTSDTITDISGRGVGMDVVKTNINRLRGDIRIDSIPGKGTDIQIMIPLTLAIVSVLIVGTGNYRFAIPQLNISEIVFINPGDMDNYVTRLGNSEVILIREELLPIVRLRTLLDIESSYKYPEDTKDQPERRNALADRRNTTDDRQHPERRFHNKDRRKNKWDSNYIVILKMGMNKFGLCVETLFDNEEIVVNPLSDYIRDCGWFCGSTILGDGRIIMILDVSGMANKAGLQFDAVNNENSRRTAEKQEHDKNVQKNKNIIIFSGMGNRYFALPLDKLSRLETISANDILKTGNYKFINYKGDVLSLFDLEELIQLDAVGSTEFKDKKSGTQEKYILIPKGLSSGIIIPGILDTMETCGRIQHNNNLPEGIKGTIIINDKVIQFLDDKIIYGLMKKHQGVQYNGHKADRE